MSNISETPKTSLMSKVGLSAIESLHETQSQDCFTSIWLFLAKEVKEQKNPLLDAAPLLQSTARAKIHPKTDCRLISLLIPGHRFRRAGGHFWKERLVAGRGEDHRGQLAWQGQRGGNRAGFCSHWVLVAIAKVAGLDCKLSLRRSELQCMLCIAGFSMKVTTASPWKGVAYTREAPIQLVSLHCNYR